MAFVVFVRKTRRATVAYGSCGSSGTVVVVVVRASGGDSDAS